VLKLPETLRQTIAAYIDDHYAPYKRIPVAADRVQEVESWAAAREEILCEDYAPQVSMPRPAKAVPREVISRPSKAAPRATSLQDMLKQEDAGFTETLLKKIDDTGKKDSEIYKKANISKQHFSKIRNNPGYKPTKPTAIALALALELDLEETRDLIGRAGYALTNSSKFDLIIRFFIEQKNYDILQINMALYEFDQPLLGG